MCTICLYGKPDCSWWMHSVEEHRGCTAHCGGGEEVFEVIRSNIPAPPVSPQSICIPLAPKWFVTRIKDLGLRIKFFDKIMTLNIAMRRGLKICWATASMIHPTNPVALGFKMRQQHVQCYSSNKHSAVAATCPVLLQQQTQCYSSNTHSAAAQSNE